MSQIKTITLPDIGEGVVEGEVVEWLKQIGDTLTQDEPVVVVMTDKATVELPAPYPGKLAKQYYQPGEVAIKDQPLYDIEVKGGAATVEIVEEVAAPTSTPKRPQPTEKKPQTSGGKALATPPVRCLAKQLGIDINQITGSGSDGRVTVEDLQGFQQPKPSPVHHFSGEKFIPLAGIRGFMAKKMAESKRTIPHFSYYEKVDATRFIQLRKNIKDEANREAINVTYMPLFIRALSLTMQQFPMINSSIDASENKIVLHQPHHIGIAMSTKEGLIVPVMKHVEKLTLEEVIRSYESLKDKVAKGHLAPNEMKGSTITISNFGVLGGGGLWATPIINYPEVAILAINKIHKQPAVKNNQLVVRDTLNLSWSFDHRIIDGDLAANVSHHFATLIQNPASLLT